VFNPTTPEVSPQSRSEEQKVDFPFFRVPSLAMKLCKEPDPDNPRKCILDHFDLGVINELLTFQVIGKKSCWTTIPKLAQRLHVDDRTIQRSLKRLRAARLIERTKVGPVDADAPENKTGYRYHLWFAGELRNGKVVTNLSPVTSESPADSHGGGDKLVAGVVTNLSPNLRAPNLREKSSSNSRACARARADDDRSNSLGECPKPAEFREDAHPTPGASHFAQTATDSPSALDGAPDPAANIDLAVVAAPPRDAWAESGSVDEPLAPNAHIAPRGSDDHSAQGNSSGSSPVAVSTPEPAPARAAVEPVAELAVPLEIMGQIAAELGDDVARDVARHPRKVHDACIGQWGVLPAAARKTKLAAADAKAKGKKPVGSLFAYMMPIAGEYARDGVPPGLLAAAKPNAASPWDTAETDKLLAWSRAERAKTDETLKHGIGGSVRERTNAILRRETEDLAAKIRGSVV
jgi:predicted transcriptional regulator